MKNSEQQTDNRELEHFLSGRKPVKGIFVLEDEQTPPPRVISVQDSPNPTNSRRRKTLDLVNGKSLAERLEVEFAAEKKQRDALSNYPGICSKCGIEPALSEFVISRDLAYCEDCADILDISPKPFGTTRK